jgi:hypothetical protein
VRKENLRKFGSYKSVTGYLSGLFVASLLYYAAEGDFIPVVALLAVYTGFWYIHKDDFSRIRKSIEDSRGGGA